MTLGSPIRIERISLELTNRCDKGCAFCYSASSPSGESRWRDPADVLRLVRDCARGGVRAVSFGGGEPLQYEGLDEVLRGLDGVLFRSLTTNGLLLLRPGRLDALARARPDKVHVSIHYPERRAELTRALSCLEALDSRGIASGVNLLVRRSALAAAVETGRALRELGVGNDRIVYLPQRGDGGRETPTPRQLAEVAGGAKFQSMSCLLRCAASPRFCSIGWDRSVAWCSYTRARRPLAELTHAALLEALEGLSLDYCGVGADAGRQVDAARLAVAWR
ncbi:MAG: radical SAM protein [Myxococcales bacterium]|nr:radical SAM protein [Myxococcales bacterium]